MTRPKKNEQQILEMREKILDAALEILNEKGPNGLSSRGIAERLGIAHMTLFTYFANRDALLLALSEREMAKIHAQQEIFEQRAKTEDISLIMEEALLFFPEFEKKNPNVYHIAWVTVLEGRANPENLLPRTAMNIQHFTRLIQIGIDQGIFEERNPSLAAASVFSMINTPLILWHSGRIPSESIRDQMVQEMLTAAMRYLKKLPNPGA
jgi:AcrR family transcriptional regulator